MTSPHVRQFSEDDRDMNAGSSLTSPSANFGLQRESKRDVTVRFLLPPWPACCRDTATAPGPCSMAQPWITIVPPGSDRRHLLHLLHRMRHRPVLGTVGPTRLAVLLQRAAATLTRRSAVFVVSDFISEAGWEVPLSHLAQRYDVVVVHMTDPPSNLSRIWA